MVSSRSTRLWSGCLYILVILLAGSSGATAACQTKNIVVTEGRPASFAIPQPTKETIVEPCLNITIKNLAANAAVLPKAGVLTDLVKGVTSLSDVITLTANGAGKFQICVASDPGVKQCPIPKDVKPPVVVATDTVGRGAAVTLVVPTANTKVPTFLFVTLFSDFFVNPGGVSDAVAMQVITVP